MGWNDPPLHVLTFLEQLSSLLPVSWFCCSLGLLRELYLGVLVEELAALCAPQQFSVGKSRLPEWYNPAGTQRRNCPTNLGVAHMQNVCVCVCVFAGQGLSHRHQGARMATPTPDGLHMWAVPMTTCMKTEMRPT